MSLTISVIIPSLNEEALILGTLESVQQALSVLPGEVTAEIIVVDNGSTDNTRQLVERARSSVQLLDCPSKGAARARNLGARFSRGDILVFLDADTTIPVCSINHIVEQCSRNGIRAGMTKLGPRDGGFRACCWWSFWNSVRLLPLPRTRQCRHSCSVREARSKTLGRSTKMSQLARSGRFSPGSIDRGRTSSSICVPSQLARPAVEWS